MRHRSDRKQGDAGLSGGLPQFVVQSGEWKGSTRGELDVRRIVFGQTLLPRDGEDLTECAISFDGFDRYRELPNAVEQRRRLRYRNALAAFGYQQGIRDLEWPNARNNPFRSR